MKTPIFSLVMLGFTGALVNPTFAQNTPTKLTQPAVTAQAQNNQVIETEQDRQFTSAYGKARPGRAQPAATPVAPVVAVPVAAPRPAPAILQPVVQAVPANLGAETEQDRQFTSAYGKSRPGRQQPPPVAVAPVVLPGTLPVAPQAITVPAPAKKDDPERLQRVVNFQRQNAASGNPSSQYDLGMRYLKGDGVEQDTKQAHDWLKLAAQNGNSRAKKELPALESRLALEGVAAKTAPVAASAEK